MTRILINGLNAKVGGGRSILTNLLRVLGTSSPPGASAIALTPQRAAFQQLSTDALRIAALPRFLRLSVLYPFVNHLLLPRLVAYWKVDSVLNLAAIPMPTSARQVFLFDWPYAIYPESPAWSRMSPGEWIKRQAKLHLFSLYLHYADTVIAQTRTSETRLRRLFELKRVVIVPNAVSLDSFQGSELPNSFDFPADKFILLCLTYYYTHKNLEILIPAAQEIRRRALPFLIVITLEPGQHRKARNLLKRIHDLHLEDVLLNVGAVPMERVPALYRAADALLLPTLLESFSGTYVEAMYHGKTVLTSDLDFAREVCGDAAFYFDPSDVGSILTAVESAFAEPEERKRKAEAGYRRLETLLGWQEVFEQIMALLTGRGSA